MTIAEQILKVLPKDPPLTTGEIAGAIGQPGPVVSVILKRLIKARKVKCSRVRVKRWVGKGRGGFTYWRAK